MDLSVVIVNWNTKELARLTFGILLLIHQLLCLIGEWHPTSLRPSKRNTVWQVISSNLACSSLLVGLR
jgi:hypothetical protein